MNKKSKALWFVFGWFIGAMMFVKPVATEPKAETKSEVTATPTIAVSMQDVFYKEYMKSCTEGSVVNATVCDCMYNRVLEELGFEEMLATAENMKQGDMPQVYIDAAVACVK